MKQTTLIFALISIISFNTKQCGKSSEWIYPLQSNDLSAFTLVNGSAEFRIEDQILIGTSALNSPNSFLALNDKYGDFILEFDVKIDLELNSGVQIRSIHDPKIKEGRVHGYQVEIETSDRKWAGGIYEESGRGWLYPLTEHQSARDAWKNETWNHYRIEAVGKTIKTWVNGVPCAHLIDDKSLRGIIAFQVHSIQDEKLSGKNVYWKNIKILHKDFEKHLIKIEGNIHQVNLTVM